MNDLLSRIALYPDGSVRWWTAFALAPFGAAVNIVIAYLIAKVL